jgi:hypothetical protein
MKMKKKVVPSSCCRFVVQLEEKEKETHDFFSHVDLHRPTCTEVIESLLPDRPDQMAGVTSGS